MKLDVITLEAGKAGDIDLSDDIFGLEPRADLLHRVVRRAQGDAQARAAFRHRRRADRCDPVTALFQ